MTDYIRRKVDRKHTEDEGRRKGQMFRSRGKAVMEIGKGGVKGRRK